MWLGTDWGNLGQIIQEFDEFCELKLGYVFVVTIFKEHKKIRKGKEEELRRKENTKKETKSLS